MESAPHHASLMHRKGRGRHMLFPTLSGESVAQAIASTAGRCSTSSPLASALLL